MTYVPGPLRELVNNRANNCCEYCRYPQHASLFAFEMEHIVAEKHGGQTNADNLALACPFCNRAKGTDLASLDPETGYLTPLFNPRTQVWSEHFRFDGARIVPLTAVGRVTVAILQVNAASRIAERELLQVTGAWYAGRSLL